MATNRILSPRLALAICTALTPATAALAGGSDLSALEKLLGEPVTTSATGKPERASEAPVNMDIVSADAIRRAGITSIADLPRVLKGLAGVNVQQVSQGVYNVGIHGYNGAFSNRILVLVNGRQVYLDHYGYTQWAAIPVEVAEIQQVEVVKGPNSALFGLNAANGVINIITRNPLNEDVGAVNMTIGTDGYRGGSAVVTTHPSSQSAIRLSAGGFRASDFDLSSSDTSTTRIDPERTSVAVDGRYALDDKTEFALEGTRTTSQGIELNPGYSTVAGQYKTWSAKLSGKTDVNGVLLDGQVYHNDLSYHEADGTSTAVGASPRFDNGVTVANASAQFKLAPAHSMRAALEYRHNTMDSTPTEGGTVGYDIYAASLMWDWQVTDRLSATNSVRVDQMELFRKGALDSATTLTNDMWDRSLTNIAFNSGLVFRATDTDTLRLSAGRAVQAPSLVDLGFLAVQSMGSSLMVISGNPNVKPTSVTSIEGGWDRQIPAWNAKLRLSAYAQQTRDISGSGGGSVGGGAAGDPTAGGAPPDSGTSTGASSTSVSMSGNIGNSRAWGIEAGLEGTMDNGLRWGANYSFAHLKDDPDDGYTLYSADATPQHSVNLKLGRDIGNWSLDGQVHYISEIFQITGSGGTNTVTKLPDYVSGDVRVGYHLSDATEVSLTGLTLFHSNLKEDSGPGVESQARLSLTTRF